MNRAFTIERREDGSLWLALPGEQAPRRVVAVGEACRRLGRSRRQVYRSIASGALESAGKFLGEILVDAASVERLALAPPAAQPLPAALERLFSEYDSEALNAGRDRVLILSRILEGGSTEDVRWAIARYGRKCVAQFLLEDGARLLSPRAFALWSGLLRVPKPAPRVSAANPWSDRTEGGRQ